MSCRIRRTQMMASSPPEKPQNQVAQAELNSKLAQIQAERDRQDMLYFSQKCETNCVPANDTNKYLLIGDNSKSLVTSKNGSS